MPANMNPTNIHNTLPAHHIDGGRAHTAAFIHNANDAQIEICRVCSGPFTPGAVMFALGVILACESAGFMAPSDVADMLDYMCVMLPED